jgi:hypothetical protein
MARVEEGERTVLLAQRLCMERREHACKDLVHAAVTRLPDCVPRRVPPPWRRRHVALQWWRARRREALSCPGPFDVRQPDLQTQKLVTQDPPQSHAAIDREKATCAAFGREIAQLLCSIHRCA